MFKEQVAAIGQLKDKLYKDINGDGQQGKDEFTAIIDKFYDGIPQEQPKPKTSREPLKDIL